MRIIADRSRCEGHGLCEEVAAEVYGLDEDAVVVLKVTGEVPLELEAKARAGARVCPVAALRTDT